MMASYNNSSGQLIEGVFRSPFLFQVEFFSQPHRPFNADRAVVTSYREPPTICFSFHQGIEIGIYASIKLSGILDWALL